MDLGTIFRLVEVLGAALVAFFAVREYRQKNFKLELKIVPSNTIGEPTNKKNDRKKVFYHFKVFDNGNKYPVKKCKVSLITIAKKPFGETKKYGETKKFNAIYTFFWTPSEKNPNIEKDFYKESIFDFGHTIENDDRFHFGLNTTLESLPDDYYVKKGETAKVSLRLEAENCAPKIQLFEITWKEELSKDTEKMEKKPVIREVGG